MQSYTSTNMNDTTTTTNTGMTLRSGQTYNKSNTTYGKHNYDLDGNDFVPLSSLTEYGWNWAQKVHEVISRTGDWDAQTSYNFLDLLESTSSSWCHTAWANDSSDDTREFGDYLMELVEWLHDEAYAMKKYPNTRSKKRMMSEESPGYCNGIIRLAKDIQTEWNVASYMANNYDNMEMNESGGESESEIGSEGEEDNAEVSGYYDESQAISGASWGC